MLDPAKILSLPSKEELLELAKKVDAQLADDEEIAEWEDFVRKEKERRFMLPDDEIEEEIRNMDEATLEAEAAKIRERAAKAPAGEEGDEDAAIAAQGGEDEGTEQECEQWNEELQKMRQIFRDEIKDEINEMNADSQEETVDLGESDLESLID